MTEIEWRPIPGLAGYEVSSTGLVRSFHRSANLPIPHLMTLVRHKVTGYITVGLSYAPQKKTTYRVHRLVTAAFVGPCPDGMEVAHIDGDQTNNNAVNLTYKTHAENIRDSVIHGTHGSTRKTHCPKGHPYSPENTYICRGWRACRECTLARNRAAWPGIYARRKLRNAA